MIMKKFNLIALLILTVTLLSSCSLVRKEPVDKDPAIENLPEAETVAGKEEEENIKTVAEDEVDTEEDKNTADNEFGFDFDKLGVKPYSYSSEEFELSDDLKGAIVEMFASTKNWKTTDAYEPEWEEIFIDRFLLNSWYGPKYIESKSVITKEEAEYIQFSLTGERLYFNMDEDVLIDRSKSSSPFNYTYMDSYLVTKQEDSYWVDSVIKTQYKYINDDGELDVKEKTEKVLITLKENPYSCFDGYSIEDIYIRYSESDDDEEELFKLIGMIIDAGGESQPYGMIDYFVASYLGEIIDNKTFTDKEGYERTTNIRVPTQKIESFYKDVLGVERTFNSGEDTGGEMCVYCDDDGYCYGLNSAGYGTYMVIDSVDRQEDKTVVKVLVMNDYEGEEEGTFEFTVIPADNEYGFSLLRD